MYPIASRRHTILSKKDDEFSNIYSMSFDGNDEWIEHAHNVAYDFDSDDPLSMIAWIYLDNDVMSNARVGGKFKDGNIGYWLGINRHDGKNKLLYNKINGDTTNGRMQVRADFDIPLNQWVKVALIDDGSTTGANMKLIIDDDSKSTTVLTDTLDAGETTTNNSSFDIAAIEDAGTLFTEAIKVDEITVWSKALSVANQTLLDRDTDARNHPDNANLVLYNRLGDGATWDGSQWTTPDLSDTGVDGLSQNMEFADRITV